MADPASAAQLSGPPVFVGSGTPLAPDDIAAAAALIGCEVTVLRAVLSVETAGQGFDGSKRPSMLFEPHIFWRLLQVQAPDRVGTAVAQGLAYPNQGEKPYPADSYPHLIDACWIDRELALMSASWGIGQVMGENFAMVGCANVEEMVAQAVASEGGQLQHMAHFILTAKLDLALRLKDWTGFAMGYNGRDEARGGYAAHLQQTYAHLSGTKISVPAIGQELTADDLNARWLAQHPDGAPA